MSSPKFRINEEVILNSDTYPEFNGEYIIQDFVGNTPKGIFVYNLGLPLFVKESSLRKKHKGSDMNFQQLMSSLNSPITREQLIENKS
jgi:hypothetical protein